MPVTIQGQTFADDVSSEDIAFILNHAQSQGGDVTSGTLPDTTGGLPAGLSKPSPDQLSRVPGMQSEQQRFGQANQGQFVADLANPPERPSTTVGREAVVGATATGAGMLASALMSPPAGIAVSTGVRGFLLHSAWNAATSTLGAAGGGGLAGAGLEAADYAGGARKPVGKIAENIAKRAYEQGKIELMGQGAALPVMGLFHAAAPRVVGIVERNSMAGRAIRVEAEKAAQVSAAEGALGRLETDAARSSAEAASVAKQKVDLEAAIQKHGSLTDVTLDNIKRLESQKAAIEAKQAKEALGIKAFRESVEEAGDEALRVIAQNKMTAEERANLIRGHGLSDAEGRPYSDIQNDFSFAREKVNQKNWDGIYEVLARTENKAPMDEIAAQIAKATNTAKQEGGTLLKTLVEPDARLVDFRQRAAKILAGDETVAPQAEAALAGKKPAKAASAPAAPAAYAPTKEEIATAAKEWDMHPVVAERELARLRAAGEPTGLSQPAVPKTAEEIRVEAVRRGVDMMNEEARARAADQGMTLEAYNKLRGRKDMTPEQYVKMQPDLAPPKVSSGTAVAPKTVAAKVAKATPKEPVVREARLEAVVNARNAANQAANAERKLANGSKDYIRSLEIIRDGLDETLVKYAPPEVQELVKNARKFHQNTKIIEKEQLYKLLGNDDLRDKWADYIKPNRPETPVTLYEVARTARRPEIIPEVQRMWVENNLGVVRDPSGTITKPLTADSIAKYRASTSQYGEATIKNTMGGINSDAWRWHQNMLKLSDEMSAMQAKSGAAQLSIKDELQSTVSDLERLLGERTQIEKVAAGNAKKAKSLASELYRREKIALAKEDVVRKQRETIDAKKLELIADPLKEHMKSKAFSYGAKLGSVGAGTLAGALTGHGGTAMMTGAAIGGALAFTPEVIMYVSRSPKLVTLMGAAMRGTPGAAIRFKRAFIDDLQQKDQK